MYGCIGKRFHHHSQDALKGRPPRPQRALERGVTFKYVEALFDARATVRSFSAFR